MLSDVHISNFWMVGSMCINHNRFIYKLVSHGVREGNNVPLGIASFVHALNIEYFRYVHGEACNSSFNLASGSGTHYTYIRMHIRHLARMARQFFRHYAHCFKGTYFPHYSPGRLGAGLPSPPSQQCISEPGSPHQLVKAGTKNGPRPFSQQSQIKN